jgi:hypothetical protein
LSNIAEYLVAYLKCLVDWHVGLVVPDNVGTDYIWVQQTSEIPNEDLCVGIDGADSQGWTMEIIADDLQVCRDTTAAIKTAFRTLPKYPTEFYSTVEFIEITDADDQYEFRSVAADDRRHGTALQMNVHLV